MGSNNEANSDSDNSKTQFINNGTVDINFDNNWFKICVMFYT